MSVKPLRVVLDQRGRLSELVRCDDPDFEKFGQVYVSVTYPGVVKGWHMHTVQTDLVSCISGDILLVMYDPRDGSPTRGEVQEVYLGVHAPLRVKIPCGIYHGWKCVSDREALVVNLASELYRYDRPDEVRLDPHGGEVPYDWTRRDG